MQGEVNLSYISDNGKEIPDSIIIGSKKKPDDQDSESPNPGRDTWGNGLEFLMSCIAMSVGLGNIWRFPFTALENGGGAFLIPYLIVLLIVGKPIYYMEMLIGQFSSRGSVKVYDFAPIMRGIGYGQITAVVYLSSYYGSLMSLTLIYFANSFADPLPWAECRPQWNTLCINSGAIQQSTDSNSTEILKNTTDSDMKYMSSAELYFINEVLHENPDLSNGVGMPDWRLTICLFISWASIVLMLLKGVKSSGKAAYFLAIFPYVVMIVLLIRAVTLPGAADGILFFVKPNWGELLNPKVWYAAVTQVFFSLSVCFGNIIMYSSYNNFRHNVHRDALIVTSLDTVTSMLAGCTIFGILGHLAYQTGTDDVASVVRGGTGLAFVSYPDAIAKFTYLPQVFSVLFFLMLFVLGIGSNVAMASCMMTVIRDRFPKVKHWQAALGIACVGFCVGTVYVTPGGQAVLNLVDHFGASFIVFFLGIAQILAISWIYGLDNFCRDVRFMLGEKVGHVSRYWRLCWGVITPILMVVILIYTLVTLTPLKYAGNSYPDYVYAIGWTLAAVGLAQLPLWAMWALYQQKGQSFLQRLWGSLSPLPHWGPLDEQTREEWRALKLLEDEKDLAQGPPKGFCERLKNGLLGQ